MWAGLMDTARNPMSLVQDKGATRRVRKPRSHSGRVPRLTELHEPFATLGLLSVCLGLRISEALGLQWGHVDWLGSRPTIRRGIVNQRVDDVKTVGSARTFDVTPALLARLQTARQRVVSSDAEG